MHASVKVVTVILMSAVMALILYAIVAAPGLLSDQASTVQLQSR